MYNYLEYFIQHMQTIVINQILFGNKCSYNVINRVDIDICTLRLNSFLIIMKCVYHIMPPRNNECHIAETVGKPGDATLG